MNDSPVLECRYINAVVMCTEYGFTLRECRALLVLSDDIRTIKDQPIWSSMEERESSVFKSAVLSLIARGYVEADTFTQYRLTTKCIDLINHLNTLPECTQEYLFRAVGYVG